MSLKISCSTSTSTRAATAPFLPHLGNSYTGRNFYYGIREHAMGSILNGIAYFGLHRCSGSTFLVFADYMRASMRLAALSELAVNYILTHDSIGVGEVRRETRRECWLQYIIIILFSYFLIAEGGGILVFENEVLFITFFNGSGVIKACAFLR